MQFALFNQQIQKRGDVSRIELARMHRHGGGQVGRRHNRDALALYDLVGFTERHIASGQTRKIDHDGATLHAIDRIVIHQNRRASSGHLSGSDNHIGTLCLFGDQIAPAL